jgi:FkbM family methyltransferase
MKPTIQTVNGRYGPCSFIKGDEYLGRSVFSYGEYNKEECEHIVALAQERPGSLILDIGANIGNVSQALVFAGFEVRAFEPQPEIYNVLKMNVKPEWCINAGLGDYESEMFMPEVDYSKRGNFGGISIGGNRGIIVDVKTLDSYNFENVGVMKIDVEGFEEKVLRGAIETIKRCKPIIYLEADRKEKLLSLAALLDELGYDHKPHNPALFSPHNFFGNPKNVWDKNYVSLNWECRYVATE